MHKAENDGRTARTWVASMNAATGAHEGLGQLKQAGKYGADVRCMAYRLLSSARRMGSLTISE